ncbi:MAG TPA: FAD-dependent oxidoreductase [Steroidobacteraceae bacterium]|nr:FAD-dependent oxidoreductase [Steroidobacteraceae bacterium]
MIRRWDVVIVGAGIHGAGVAQAAAAAGHSALVLEQSAIAAGSSSRSSKLIHGGLRYLESGQVRLVRESLHERRLMLRLAPTLVQLQKFYIPVYRHTRRRPWQLRIGLSLYALLGGRDASTHFGTVPRAQWAQLDGLATQDLEQVFWYHDAQTDDALLTAAVMRSAQSLGAELALPAQFLGATLGQEAVQVRFRHAGAEQECEAGVLVNAAGAWAGALARCIEPKAAVPALELVQGSHLVYEGAPQAGVYYVESPRDGRAIFVMPWRGKLLVGTTEVRFRGDPATVAPGAHEVHYLQEVLRHYFPRFRDAALAPPVASFAGLRVLPAGEGHAFHRSRETLLTTDRAVRPRLLSVYGGKLTTWRAVSARALAMIAASLPARPARARTDQLELHSA